VLVAGCILLQVLLDMNAFKQTDWGIQVKNTLQAQSIQGWCGYNQDRAETRAAETCDEMVSVLQQLSEKYIILDKQGARITTKKAVFRMVHMNANTRKVTHRSFARFYLVPKGETFTEDGKEATLGRMILSCRRVNTQFAKPPKVTLPSIGDLFGMVNKFERPFFVVLDYRHYFFQIPLPGEVSAESPASFFSIKTKTGQIWEMEVLPMGFSWSPFIAQNISMGLLYEARSVWAARRGLSAQPPPKEAVEAIIEVKNGAGECVAMMTTWYDNVIITAIDEATREGLCDALYDVLQRANVVVKDSLEDQIRRLSVDKAGTKRVPDPSEMPQRTPESKWDGWTRREGAVEYIGIHMQRRQEDVGWRHVTKNVDKWKVALSNAKRESSTARDIASFIGIIMWDLTVSGEPKGVRGGTLRTMGTIGAKMQNQPYEQWDKPMMLSVVEWNNIIEEMQGLCDRSESPTLNSRTKWDASTAKNVVYIAVDSSERAAGAIKLTPEGGEPIEVQHHGASRHGQWHWSAEERSRSINWKETTTAIMAIYKVIADLEAAGKNLHESVIVIGEDNATAISSLQHFFYASDPQLCGTLLKLLEDLKGARLMTKYVQSAEMPADDPSRKDLEWIRHRDWEPWQAKCRRCHQALTLQFQEAQALLPTRE